MKSLDVWAVYLVCVYDPECFIEAVNIRYPLFAGANKDAVSCPIPITLGTVRPHCSVAAVGAERAAAPGVKVQIHTAGKAARGPTTALRPRWHV